MVNILLVEDNYNLRLMMSEFLKQNGYNVYESENGKNALKTLESIHIDLLITDVMMPQLDGFELVYMLRESNYRFPILMVTVKSEYKDKESGFTYGADDYMVKPVDLNEMLLRIKALLRRSQISSEQFLKVGELTLDYQAQTASINGKSTLLPAKEFLLLFKLLSQPNRIYTRFQLMEMIWGMDSETDERTVDVHIKRLRSRFKSCKDFEIITVRGLGYKGVRYDNFQ